MEATGATRRTLWIDVSTLVGWHGNPTGIARTVSQMLPHLLAEPELPLRLCRFDAAHECYFPVEPAALGRPGQTTAAVTWSSSARRRNLLGLLPRNLRLAFWHQGQSIASAYGLVKSVYYKGVYPTVVRLKERLRRQPPPPIFARGDVLFVAGAGWTDQAAAVLWAQLRRELAMQVVNLVYDITPARCPHLCDPRFSRAFTAWLPYLLHGSDLILSISRYSRQDLCAYGNEHGLPTPPVEVIRLGDEPGADQSEEAPEVLADGRPFVLFVSSVSAHKNHQMLLHVWRRLAERHGDALPTLALVGGTSYRGGELLDTVACDPLLSRRVVHLQHANDRQLRWLYRRCRFTVYPSHYEGWGLPVAESLMYGKHCVCANATSLPEVGGTLADYHDPLDGPGYQRVLERVLFEPGFLASREERIRREHRLTTWKQCAGQVVDLLDRHCQVRPHASREAA